MGRVVGTKVTQREEMLGVFAEEYSYEQRHPLRARAFLKYEGHFGYFGVILNFEEKTLY
jgi:hypothetical protein